MTFKEAYRLVSTISGSVDRQAAKMLWFLASNQHLSAQAFQAELLRKASRYLYLGGGRGGGNDAPAPRRVAAKETGRVKRSGGGWGRKHPRNRTVKMPDEKLFGVIRTLLGNGKSNVRTLSEALEREIGNPVPITFLRRKLRLMGPDVRWDNSEKAARVYVVNRNKKSGGEPLRLEAVS